ncbi:MAG: hypothetical protein ACRDZW_09555, partial [Acidimicrobiales bacterium]
RQAVAPVPVPAPKADRARPPAPARSTQIRPLLALFEAEAEADGDDGDDRPTHIVRGPQEMRQLLEVACERDWLVRMAYTNKSGQPNQSCAAILALDAGAVFVERLPRGDLQTISLTRLRWARVLSEAEEECLS